MSTSETAFQTQSVAERPQARSTRRFRVSFYMLILLAGVLQTSLTPLIPTFAGRFSLDSTAVGVLVGSSGLSMLLVCLPAGSLADRLGARRLTLAAGWLLVASAVGQAFAPSFGILVVARLIFGAGYGVLWTAGLAWLSEVSGEKARAGLGATVVLAGLGGVLGPVFGGVVSQSLGVGAPFLLAGLCLAGATAALGSTRARAAVERREQVPILAAVRLVGGDIRAMTALAAVVISGVTYSVTTQFDPLELHASGFSTGTIGMAFSGAALLYVLGSALTSARGKRSVTVAATMTAVVAGAAILAPAGLSAAPLVVVAVLCSSAAVRGVLWSLAYPLAGQGAERSGAGTGVVFGLLNAVSAVTNVVTPIVAGAAGDSFGTRGAFDLVVLGCAGVVGCWWVYQRALRPSLRGKSVSAPRV